jgi:hypothetical protein
MHYPAAATRQVLNVGAGTRPRPHTAPFRAADSRRDYSNDNTPCTKSTTAPANVTSAAASVV